MTKIVDIENIKRDIKKQYFDFSKTKESFNNNRYYSDIPFTDFNKVNKRTSLKKLNLNWGEKDLPERIRTKHVHRLHPYLGKFIPQIPEIFLRKFKPKCVLDPFMGSGTTMVESLSLGIDSIGVDISEFNCLISKVKTDNYDINLLTKEVDKMLGFLNDYKEMRENRDQFSLFQLDESFLDKVPNNDYFEKWFSEKSREGLYFFLSKIEQFHYLDFFKLVLSRSTRSSRKVKHFDLDFPKEPQNEPYDCRKHHRTCKPTSDSLKFLVRYLKDGLKRITEFSNIKHDNKSKIIHGDSTKVDFGEFDLVFTSPPYVGLLDYHEQHKYSFEILGLDIEKNKEKEIGRSKLGLNKKSKELYRSLMSDVYKNIHRQLPLNCRVITVVNDKHNIYKPKDFGFRETQKIERHVNRRTGRRNSDFYESILIWKKVRNS